MAEVYTFPQNNNLQSLEQLLLQRENQKRLSGQFEEQMTLQKAEEARRQKEFETRQPTEEATANIAKRGEAYVEAAKRRAAEFLSKNPGKQPSTYDLLGIQRDAALETGYTPALDKVRAEAKIQYETEKGQDPEGAFQRNAQFNAVTGINPDPIARNFPERQVTNAFGEPETKPISVDTGKVAPFADFKEPTVPERAAHALRPNATLAQRQQELAGVTEASRAEHPIEPSKPSAEQDAALAAAAVKAGRPLTATERDQVLKEVDLRKPTFRIENPTPASDFQKENQINRSYDVRNKELLDLEKPLRDRAERSSRAIDTLNQNKALPDSLLAPEMIVIMAGGGGSGVRVNTSEINKIEGGMVAWEGIQKWVNKLKTDQSAQLPPEYRKAAYQLLYLVNNKLQAKLGIIKDAREKLIDAKDPTEHKRILAGADAAINDVDAKGIKSPVQQLIDQIKEKANAK